MDLKWQIYNRLIVKGVHLLLHTAQTHRDREKRMDNLLIWTYSFSPSLAVHPYVSELTSVCVHKCSRGQRKRINDCNKWRWTLQGLCSLHVFFSFFLSPTAKYKLISMHIYNLYWTNGSPVFSEVIGLLCGAESTISNTHRISNPFSNLWWYKAFVCNSCLFRHYVPWVWWKFGFRVGFWGVNSSCNTFILFYFFSFIL